MASIPLAGINLITQSEIHNTDTYTDTPQHTQSPKVYKFMVWLAIKIVLKAMCTCTDIVYFD